MKKRTFMLCILSVLLLVVSGCAKNGPADTETDWTTIMNVNWDEHSVKLDTGIDMAYMTCGPEDGTPIVLIHGATDSRNSWSQLAPILSDAGYHCFIPELRGHGKTSKPVPPVEGYTVEQHTKDILDFMDKINLEHATIVGHSLGSIITQELLITTPERVDKAVLISSTASIVGNPTVSWILNGDGTDFLGVNGYSKERKIPDEFIKSWTSTSNEAEDFQKAVYEHAKSLPYEAWYGIFKGCDQVDNTQRLSSVTAPVDVIWGTGDELFLKEDQELLQLSLSNADLQTLDINGATHNIHWDSKNICQQVADEIIRFVNEK
ncbi:alpha/beta fold hydrolase [Hungatella hathewayi]|uniref:alpha/beta fold hydrolase n=1 Tax=Hungatella hathewayi TaxID=154046 RepID=UPI0015F42945|nr:alpha/beta hydrolase [Hungatella hathewayi]